MTGGFSSGFLLYALIDLVRVTPLPVAPPSLLGRCVKSRAL